MATPVIVSQVAVSPASNNELAELTKYVQTSLSNATEDIKKREESLLKLGKLLADSHELEALRTLIQDARPFLVSIGSAKSVKIIKALIELCLKIPVGDDNVKVNVCNECVQWAKDQNRVYLRQTLQARLVRLLNDLGRYTAANQLANEIIHELKRLDDKDLIIEVHLENSKAYYALSSHSKAKTYLIAARTIANGLYVSPKMQAALDMQSGIIHAGEEGDFKTAFSYFFEALEGYDSVTDKDGALRGLKYMLLCQIMIGNYDEIKNLLMHKTAHKYSSSEIDAMVSISKSAKNRSLAEFNAVLDKYGDMLKKDVVIRQHLNSLSSTMLEKDICRLVTPYSHVEISHLAKTIGMTSDKVERKLSQMILDRKLSGCLDQGKGILIIFNAPVPDRTYQLSIEALQALNETVDALYARASKIRY